MGRVAEAAIILGCISVVVYVIAARYYQLKRRALRAHAPYQLKELTVHVAGGDECRQLYGVCGSDRIKLSEPVPVDDEFSFAIEEARSEAREKLVALNSGKRVK